MSGDDLGCLTTWLALFLVFMACTATGWECFAYLSLDTAFLTGMAVLKTVSKKRSRK